MLVNLWGVSGGIDAIASSVASISSPSTENSTRPSITTQVSE